MEFDNYLDSVASLSYSTTDYSFLPCSKESLLSYYTDTSDVLNLDIPKRLETDVQVNTDLVGKYDSKLSVKKNIKCHCDSIKWSKHRYRLLKKLGEGGFSKVYEAIRIGGTSTTTKFAIKIFKSDNKDTIGTTSCKYLAVEKYYLDRLRWFKCKEGLDYVDCVSISANITNPSKFKIKKVLVGLVFPYQPYCLDNISSYEYKFTMDKLMYNLLEGLRRIHETGIIHCDVKRSNIFVTDKVEMSVIFADFGSATDPFNKICDSKYSISSVQIRSPERFAKSIIDTKVDVFSMGVVFSYLATQRHVMLDKKIVNQRDFKSEECKKMCLEIRLDKNVHQWMKRFIKDECLRDLLQNMLKNDPKQRYTIKQSMNHKFFDKCKEVITTITPQIVGKKRSRDFDIFDIFDNEFDVFENFDQYDYTGEQSMRKVKCDYF